MKLKQGEDYAFENGGQFLVLALKNIYDRYTRYRKDYAVTGESLDYSQFCKQLEHTAYFVSKGVKKRFGDKTPWVWVLDFYKLEKACDVSGFVTEDEQLRLPV